jgi:hypothetical protein
LSTSLGVLAFDTDRICASETLLVHTCTTFGWLAVTNVTIDTNKTIAFSTPPGFRIITLVTTPIIFLLLLQFGTELLDFSFQLPNASFQSIIPAHTAFEVIMSAKFSYFTVKTQAHIAHEAFNRGPIERALFEAITELQHKLVR